MPFRSPAALFAALLLTVVTAGPGRAADFTDSAGRRVPLPDHIDRVLTAGPTADVLVFVLAPEKLVGWSRTPQAAYLPPRYGRLPVTGLVLGPDPGFGAAIIDRAHPDLVIDAGPVTPERAALADRLQQLTRVPYILVDDSIPRMPGMLRALGAVLGTAPRAEDLAMHAEHALDAVRGRLLIQPGDARPRVYYARGADGLETALPGSPAGAAIDEAGAINVAGVLGRGERVVVSPPQVRAWAPDIIIAEQRGFYAEVQHNPIWREIPAVRARDVYLAPSSPFGWIDDPPGVNRLIGLLWLSTLFYPDETQDDLRTSTQDFYNAFYRVKLTDAQLNALVKPAESHRKPKGELGEALLGPGPPPEFVAPSSGPPGMGPPGRRGLGPPTPLTPDAAPKP